MSDKPKPEAARKGTNLEEEASYPEQAHKDPLDARLAELDRRIAEIGDRLTTSATAASPAAPVPIDTRLISQQNEQIAELQKLVSGLGEQLLATQGINARDEQFKAAVRNVENAAAMVQRSLISSNIGGIQSQTPTNPAPAATIPAAPERECGCKDEKCSCTSTQCCTFEIWMCQVRADQMQLPIPSDLDDTNLLPTGVMEVWMFASIDPLHNIGACIPDPSPLSYVPLHKQITENYGPWVAVNRLIGTATVKKGTPLTVPITLTAVEREDAFDRIIPVNRDEWGSATENVTLDCCFANYSPVHVNVPLTSWGQAGGAISGKFIVRKVC